MLHTLGNSTKGLSSKHREFFSPLTFQFLILYTYTHEDIYRDIQQLYLIIPYFYTSIISSRNQIWFLTAMEVIDTIYTLKTRHS